MARNKKFEGKTIEELEQMKDESLRRLQVEEHRLNRMEQKLKEAEKRDRTHRLVVKGAEFEKMFPETKELEQEAFQELMKELHSYGFVREIVDKAVEDSRQKQSAPLMLEEVH